MQVKTTYVEMLSHNKQSVPPPRDGLSIVHAKNPTTAYYRFLYGTVGADYYWMGRNEISDKELVAVVQDPKVEIHVLLVDGVPAGFAELDRHNEDDIELVQFGLMPEFIGKGLGRFFLQWTIDKVWSYQPKRFWLHTCELDHPAALPNYLKTGFVVYKEEMVVKEI